jgi:predicted RNA-binding Zn ribbon-like protein
VRRSGLDPLTARRFRTGRVCLDFVHTGGVGRWVAAELVHDEADLARWLSFLLGLPRVQAGPEDLVAARRLRDALWNLAQQRVAGRPLGAADVDEVNATAQAPPPVALLRPDGGVALAGAVPAAQALSALARDAIDLLSGPLGGRIRTCASPNCELLFVDASRPGRRRWCSMERCGTLVKMRTYRSRRGSGTQDAAPPAS